MVNNHKRAGFTIVELIVVIVVIAILAAITLVAYSNVQKNAEDTKIRTTVDDVGKALQVKYFDGQTSAEGYWSNGNGTTTFGVDQLVIPDFMPAGYRDDLSSTNVPSTSNIFRLYDCGSGFALYASLNKPSDEEKANLDAVKIKCDTTDSQVPTTGTRKYNYAKAFR
ncbi:MAG: prepilin-type N-terminal cleavage/methylation domain-containing protein [bacterium]|nr:prepilin-type N-terminal cleavage/methylation domain-containing protein [bacterium]